MSQCARHQQIDVSESIQKFDIYIYIEREIYIYIDRYNFLYILNSTIWLFVCSTPDASKKVWIAYQNQMPLWNDCYVDRYHEYPPSDCGRESLIGWTTRGDAAQSLFGIVRFGNAMPSTIAHLDGRKIFHFWVGTVVFAGSVFSMQKKMFIRSVDNGSSEKPALVNPKSVICECL